MSDDTPDYPHETEIQPFHGIRYDTGVAGTLSSLLCPPYDIISDAQRLELYSRSPYNMIRLEYTLPDPEGIDDVYLRAAATFRDWLGRGVLRRDPAAALYVHDHAFEYRGHRHVRRGLVARVRLRPWYQGVYPHELTGTRAKQDRLDLMRACRASFSGPLGLFEDTRGFVAGAIDHSLSGAQRLDVAQDGESHTFYVLTEPEAIAGIQAAMKTEPVYIADGHHRYETALVYQVERRATTPVSVCTPQSYDYIVMTLTAFDDPGLFISPVYRILQGFRLPPFEDIEAGLSRYFSIDFVPVESALARGAPVGEMALMAVVGLRDGLIAELRPRPGVVLGNEVAGDHSLEYRMFNVSILNHIVMSRVLGIDPDGEGVSYTPDLDEVMARVGVGGAQLGFLLAPPHPRLVKKIADQQERMPRKSTYFYPKPPTGLVVNPFD
jgi:uncharacterized protein (DUF1015 family)